MKSSLSLSTKIILLALINLALLVGAFALVAKLYYSVELTSLLFAPAHDRVVNVAREIALDLEATPVAERSGLMTRFATLYGADFYLFRNDGREFAGRSVELPAEVFEELSRGQRQREDDTGGRRPPPPPPPRRDDGKRPPPPRDDDDRGLPPRRNLDLGQMPTLPNLCRGSALGRHPYANSLP